MQENKIKVTWEAIYDVTEIADYIEEEFGVARADQFVLLLFYLTAIIRVIYDT